MAEILELVSSSESRAVVDVKVGAPVGSSDHVALYFALNMASEQSSHILRVIKMRI